MGIYTLENKHLSSSVICEVILADFSHSIAFPLGSAISIKKTSCEIATIML